MSGGGAPHGPGRSTGEGAPAPRPGGLQPVGLEATGEPGAPGGVVDPARGAVAGAAQPSAPQGPPVGHPATDALGEVHPGPGLAPPAAPRRPSPGPAPAAGPGAAAGSGAAAGGPAGGGPAAPRDYADRVPFPEVLSLRPVAVMRSPFRERHGTPRQGVVDDQPLPPTEGEVVLLDDIPVEALSDLVGFARVWLLSWMHLNNPAWSPTVRPPRGGQRRGVFATRSPHRPNPIALSCVELVGVDGRRLRVRGHDLIDGTPILDIKPYLPFADAFPGAAAGWVDALPRGPDGRPLGPRLKRP